MPDAVHKDKLWSQTEGKVWYGVLTKKERERKNRDRDRDSERRLHNWSQERLLSAPRCLFVHLSVLRPISLVLGTALRPIKMSGHVPSGRAVVSLDLKKVSE